MARILILDTATKQCSVALSEHGHAVAWKEERTDGYVHAERLMPLIDALLDEHGWDKSSLEAVAVSPGGQAPSRGCASGSPPPRACATAWDCP